MTIMIFRFAGLGPVGNHIVNDSDPTPRDMIEYSSGLGSKDIQKIEKKINYFTHSYYESHNDNANLKSSSLV